jgi:hypothetical protein
MRQLAKNPKANLVILGDFNESHPVGDARQSLAVIFKSRPPMVDALSALSSKVRTQTDGNAYDRIIVSDGLANGLSGLKLVVVQIQEHRHGNGGRISDYTRIIFRWWLSSPRRCDLFLVGWFTEPVDYAWIEDFRPLFGPIHGGSRPRATVAAANPVYAVQPRPCWHKITYRVKYSYSYSRI